MATSVRRASARKPEVWRGAADLDTFDVKGSLPDIDDERLEFVKGWFDDTLPKFL